MSKELHTLTSAKLNIGCGGIYRRGWLNIDLHHPVADVRADATLLPFEDESFERADLIHVIEHLGYVGAQHALAEAHRVLHPDGILVIETPDLEGSCELFLADRSPERRAQLLSWIFGLEAPGYRHQLLFPAELLQLMLSRAGFEDIRMEPPRYHRYAPGLRMAARRGGHAAHRVLSLLRRWLRETRAVDVSDQRQAVELEQTFFDSALALGGVSELPADQITLVLENILTAPPLARVWLELSRTRGLELEEHERLERVCHAAIAQQLSARVDAAFVELFTSGTSAADGYQEVRDWAVHALRQALAAPQGQQESVLAELLPAPADARTSTSSPLTGALLPAPADARTSTSSPLTGALLPAPAKARTSTSFPLTRALLLTHVNNLHDHAVAMLCRGEDQDGMTLLERTAAARIDPLYPLWNLGVACARCHDLESACRHYRAALAESVPETDSTVAGELATCLLHAGRPTEALALAGQYHLDHVAAVAHDMINERAPSLPPLRAHPVSWGECLYHAPDAA